MAAEEEQEHYEVMEVPAKGFTGTFAASCVCGNPWPHDGRGHYSGGRWDNLYHCENGKLLDHNVRFDRS